MKRSLVILAALAALAGCASLNDAGHSSYTVTRGAAGYEFATKDGKEYAAGRQVQFQTVDGAATLTITEGKSLAFRGQAIGAKAAAVFPVTDLANILLGQ